MKKREMIIISGLLLLFLSGCATMPTQKEISALDYGPPLTIDHQAVIKGYFEEVLYDPYSAHYKFETPPRLYWYKEPPLLGNKLYAGYVVFVGVNAKNRMGGYVGMKKYGFLFKNDRIIKILQPEDIRFMRSR